MATTIAPKDIVDDEMYFVVNTARRNIVINAGHIHGDDVYNWKGVNDPDSTMGEVRLAVPGSVVKKRQFQLAMAKGVLKFESAEDYYGSIQEEVVAGWDDDTEALDAIDRSAQDGFDFVTCIGPPIKGSGNKICGEQVIVRESAKAERPPLCDPHERFAQFFTYDADSGWTRIPA